MAIRIDTKTQHGLSVDNAYHKIHLVQSHGPNAVSIQIDIFASEEARRTNKYILETRNIGIEVPLAIEGETYYQWMYRALKLLPEYADAVDA